ncbi:hypothetical protein U1Q18_037586, partial [Sarracenia purpurea var. burkii]
GTDDRVGKARYPDLKGHRDQPGVNDSSPVRSADWWAVTQISSSDLSRLPLSLRLLPSRVLHSSKTAKAGEASSLSGKKPDVNGGDAQNPRQEITSTASQSHRRHLWLNRRRFAAGSRLFSQKCRPFACLGRSDVLM